MGNYLFGYLIFRPEASAILWDPKGSFQLPEKGNPWKSTLDPVQGQPPPKMLTEPRRTKETTVPDMSRGWNSTNEPMHHWPKGIMRNHAKIGTRYIRHDWNWTCLVATGFLEDSMTTLRQIPLLPCHSRVLSTVFFLEWSSWLKTKHKAEWRISQYIQFGMSACRHSQEMIRFSHKQWQTGGVALRKTASTCSGQLRAVGIWLQGLAVQIDNDVEQWSRHRMMHNVAQHRT